jgi:succinoglycan biosynthesis protein ExoM
MSGTSASGVVLVAIPTRGRRDLRPALEALAKQVADLDHLVEVVVLDNSGPETLVDAELVEQLGGTVHAVLLPGLAQVRNAAIDLLDVRHAALIFLDDDECPEPTWLAAMLDVQDRFTATVVVGPVSVRIPFGSPGWLGDGSFWRTYPQRADGPQDGEAYSGNTLLDAAFLRDSGLRFDTAYDHTGGEDTDFFRRLRGAGGRVAWSNGAAVTELLDADRASLRGALRRAFHAANLSWRIDRAGLTRGARSTAFARRSARLVRGLGDTVAGAALRQPARSVRGLCDCAATAGTWSSAFGWKSHYYR